MYMAEQSWGRGVAVEGNGCQVVGVGAARPESDEVQR